MFFVKILALVLCFFLISPFSYASNIGQTSNPDQSDIYCKDSYEYYGPHLIALNPIDSAISCLESLEKKYQVSFDPEKERNESFWKDYFSKKDVGLYFYNDFLKTCKYLNEEDTKDYCKKYEKFISEATLKGDETYINEVIYNDLLAEKCFKISLEDCYNDLRNSFWSKKDFEIFNQFELSLYLGFPDNCSNYKDYKEVQFTRFKKRSDQAKFLFAIFECTRESDDIFAHKLVKDILDFLNHENPYFSLSEFVLISNVSYFIVNYGSNADLERLEKIVINRTGLEDLDSDLLLTWLKNLSEIEESNSRALNVIHGSSLKYTYLNFNELYLNRHWQRPFEFAETRTNVINALDKFSSNSTMATFNSDTGLQILQLGRLENLKEGTKSCDLSATFFDKAIESNNDKYESASLSLAENLLLLTNCYLDTKFEENRNIKKAEAYLLASEKIYISLSKSLRDKISDTFRAFLKLKIEFFEGNKKDHLDKLNLIFKDFLANENNFKVFTWDDLFDELITSYAFHVSALLDDGIFYEDLAVKIENLIQLKEKVDSLNSLKYSELLNKDSLSLEKEKFENNFNSINALEKSLKDNFEARKLKELERLYGERRKIVNDIYSTNAKFEKFKNTDFAEIEKISRNLKTNEAILYLHTSPSGSFSILKLQDQKDDRFFYTQVNAYTFELFTKDLRKSILDGYGKDSFRFETAFALYRMLFKSIDEYLGGDFNIYLYGSKLESLPYQVLISEPIEDLDANFYKKLLDANWLIHKYNFSRIYPIKNKLNKTYKNKFLGIANSSFKQTKLAPLINASNEIKSMAIASQSNENLFFDKDATKKNFLKFSEQDFERVAIATHAVEPFWNGVTSEPAIIFNDLEKDFILTASEISTMNINSDMVVLSMCNSDIKSFNSIYKSFLVAGSNSVLYTHWELDDKSAPEITEDFFKRLWFNPSVPKHELLRESLLEIKANYSNTKFAHPAFWGNFTLAYGALNQ